MGCFDGSEDHRLSRGPHPLAETFGTLDCLRTPMVGLGRNDAEAFPVKLPRASGAGNESTAEVGIAANGAIGRALPSQIGRLQKGISRRIQIEPVVYLHVKKFWVLRGFEPPDELLALTNRVV